MRIEYPINKSYIEGWGVWEACREFLQNAMDSGKYDYWYDVGKFVLTNEGSIPRERLLLGESVKTDGSRGKFGEGMKLAMFVLARKGRRCVVYSGTEKWTPSMQFSETFKQETFCVEVENKKSSKVRVELEITNEEYRELSSKWILNDYGIVPEKRKGLIFVGGLYVCTMKGLEYAYNFKPIDIKLNRDRDIPSMFDVQWAAKEYLTGEQMLDGALKGKNDAGTYGYVPKIAAAWHTKYPNYTPVGISEQGQVDVPNPMVVPDWLAKAVRSVGEFFIKHTCTPIERLEKFYKDNQWQLNAAGKQELKEIINALQANTN